MSSATSVVLFELGCTGQQTNVDAERILLSNLAFSLESSRISSSSAVGALTRDFPLAEEHRSVQRGGRNVPGRVRPAGAGASRHGDVQGE